MWIDVCKVLMHSQQTAMFLHYGTDQQTQSGRQSCEARKWNLFQSCLGYWYFPGSVLLSVSPMLWWDGNSPADDKHFREGSWMLVGKWKGQLTWDGWSCWRTSGLGWLEITRMHHNLPHCLEQMKVSKPRLLLIAITVLPFFNYFFTKLLISDQYNCRLWKDYVS